MQSHGIALAPASRAPASSTSSSLLERARALAPALGEHRATHDQHKQLARPVVDALRDGGFLAALAPRELGGHELTAPQYLEVLEALARGDSATAWCVMTAATSALVTTYLPRATVEEIWREGAPFLAGIFAPGGQLTAAPDAGSEAGGLRLTGRWSYASGSRHADWFVVGALEGKRHRVCFLPASQVTVLDNWNVLGLAGTGSHDLAIEGAAVPSERVTSLFERTPWSQGALYRVPIFGLLASGIAACGLGIAGAALERAAIGLDDKASSSVLARHATCRAQLDAARAYLVTTAAAAQERAAAGGSISDARTRGELRLASSYVAQQCAEITRAAFHLVGGAAARADHPTYHQLGAALRDVEMLCTHRMEIGRASCRERVS
jgi:alkylation response protein AidB-like acyl-CoA dehydrogenase